MADTRDEDGLLGRTLIDRPVDLNTASRDQLMAVPGVGEGRADRIIAWRERHGRFEAVEDLQHVPDIGPEVMARLRDYLRV